MLVSVIRIRLEVMLGLIKVFVLAMSFGMGLWGLGMAVQAEVMVGVGRNFL